MAEAAEVLRALLACADLNVRHKAAVKLLEFGFRTAGAGEMERRAARAEQDPAGTTAPVDPGERLSYQELKQIARQAIAEMRGESNGQSRDRAPTLSQALPGHVGEPVPSPGAE